MNSNKRITLAMFVSVFGEVFLIFGLKKCFDET